MSPSLLNPHRWIKPRNGREAFLIDFLDALWADHRAQNAYLAAYEEIVQSHRARFFNDHVAFRTFATQKPFGGWADVSRPFEALGYVPVACYEFPDKSLSSIHFRPPRPEFPKIFVSQLKTWELSIPAQKIIHKAMAHRRPPPDDAVLADLRRIDGIPARRRSSLLARLVDHHRKRPWDPPQKKDVMALDKESQFGAWVLVNGFAVNHFTASVESHGVRALDDIEKVQAAFLKAGVPMKMEIEGRRGDRLRQTATEAVVRPAKVKDGRKTTEIPWTHAYFEVAERPLTVNPATGRREKFEGFLGPQATNLFEMTRLPTRR